MEATKVLVSKEVQVRTAVGTACTMVVVAA